jgi:hypothetical protein
MRRALTALGLPLLLSVVATGCGGPSGRAAVKLAIYAPTDGATVVVRNVYALGTVEPSSAVVALSGRQLQVSHGTFRQRVTLHRGLNHLRLVARAPGYLPAIMNLAVRSEPTPKRPASDQANAPQPFPLGSNYSRPDKRYSPAVQAEFLRTCRAAAYRVPGAAESCSCALRYLEAHIAQTTLASTERAILNGEGTVPQWLRDAALACRGGQRALR